MIVQWRVLSFYANYFGIHLRLVLYQTSYHSVNYSLHVLYIQGYLSFLFFFISGLSVMDVDTLNLVEPDLSI